MSDPDRTAGEPDLFQLHCVAGDPRWETIPDPDGLCTRAAQACQPAINRSGALEATVLLTNDSQIRDLNARFRNQDRPTNVLSFVNEEEEPDAGSDAFYLGDIAISYDTVLREAEETGKTLQDHLTHMIVHGILHLAGFDHDTDAEAEEMEGQEIEILLGLGIVDPYMAI